MSEPPLSSLQSETPGDLVPGTRLGKYELIRRLSVGGMAEIFLARARGLPGFQMQVVIKRILPQLAAHQEFVEMFLDEARIAATLQHPHVVQIYDVCVINESYFIAMEYLHGEDVNSILRNAYEAGKRVPIEHVLQIMIALLSGLHYAHDKEGFDGRPLNVVHCDVSPGNLIVTYEGGIKLVDFGIATAALRAGETRTGAVQGKIGYMSPEQASGEKCDRRTDVYAAGVILYELSTGRKLYKGTSDFDILARVMRGQFVPPHEVDPDYDPQLEAIVLRALEGDRERRYPTAHAMQMELEAFAKERGVFMSTTSLKSFMGELFGRKISDLPLHRQAPEVALAVLPYEDTAAGSADSLRAIPPAPSATPPELPRAPAVPPSRRGRTTAIVAIAAGVIGVAALAALGATRLRPPSPPPLAAAPPLTSPVIVAAPSPAPSPGSSSRPVATGAVRVVTHPHDATLYLDGKELDARSPAQLDDVEAGRAHTLLGKRAGYKDESRRVEVTPGGKVAVTLNLQRLPGAAKEPALTAPTSPTPPPSAHPTSAAKPTASGPGTLAMITNPWCSVTVDGKDRGQTPLTLELPAGTHTITLANPEFKIKRVVSVVIKPGELVRKRFDFTE